MQAPPGSQRPPQRRSPVSDPNAIAASTPAPAPPPSAAAQNAATSGARSSSGSGKTSKRARDPATQLSQIEKSVTHLLIATKQLLETLTQWSRHTATEAEVSDVYVRLGYEFNIACRAFTSIGVPTDDLGPVPDLLRGILEETLSQEASPASLDKFLPRIRDIIINLLHGLKKKQSKLRANKARESASLTNGQASRQASSQASGGSGETVVSNSVEDVPQYKPSHRASERRTDNGGGATGDDQGNYPRGTSIQNGVPTIQEDPRQYAEDTPARSDARESRQGPPSLTDSSMSSNTAQGLPVLMPEEYKQPSKTRMLPHEALPKPPPPPKQQDAMALLQRGGELERRASRRYSAYQISKHLGASPGGVPMLPPSQNTPIPNRGREVRESLNAVRTRGSLLPSRQRSTRERASPSRGTAISRRISEESGGHSSPAAFKPPPEPRENDSPVVKTPEDKLGPSYIDARGDEQPSLRSTVSGPPPDALPQFEPSAAVDSEKEPPAKVPERLSLTTAGRQHPPRDEVVPDQFIPEESPQPGTALTLFLQYKSKIKKFVLLDGLNELSIARLQLAFIEKFAWNTHSNGNDLPEIYIQDPVSGVRHELEDLNDVKDRSVLVLNVEALDEVKRHIDEGLGGIRKIVEGVRSAIDGQQAALSQVSERQQNAAQEISRLSVAPPAARVQVNGVRQATPSSSQSVHEVQSLRRDLAIMRQTFSSFTSGVTSSMAAIRAKADTVKAKAIDAALPILDGDTGRAYVDAGKKTVHVDSESIVNRVDDLQDTVEELRKDVVLRGVRPLPRQLDGISKEISDATKDLKRMQDYVKKEKPTWTKIWEKELELVCNDREFLTMQEELIADLEDDLDKATQTMALVEQATKQQHLESTNTTQQVTLRSNSRGIPVIDTALDPLKAKDGVLGEVRALQPNHESRLEAIERAEKNRQRELENRKEGAAFKQELGGFVEEGRLKKTGGIEEAERLRKLKDERAIQEEHLAIQETKAARAKARAEKKVREAEELAAQQAAEQARGVEAVPGDGVEEEVKQENVVEEPVRGERPPSRENADSDRPESVSPSKRSSWLPAIFTT